MTLDDVPQISLPGQAHVADGPHDQSGMYLMHHAFRRDLARFESAVRTTPLGETVTWAALAARWRPFAEALHHHHAVEDDHIWPIVVRRVAETGDEHALETLAAMADEHHLIDPALASCARDFAAMAAHPCADHRNALDVSVTTVRALLADHLAHEETETLPLMQRVLTVEDFAATEAAAAKAYPPRMIPFLVPWSMHEVPTGVAGDFLRRAGVVYAVLWRLTRGRFERRERVAFRHAG